MRTPLHWLRKGIVVVVGLYLATLLGLIVLQALAPQRAGLLALSEIFAPYLFLPALVVCPLALLRGTRPMRAALLVCVAVFALRYAPPLHAAPAAPSRGPQISVTTWNVFAGGRPDAIRAALLAHPTDLMALEETHTDWIIKDPALTRLYPYRQVLAPWDAGGVSGMILLSTYPVMEQGLLDAPAALWTRPDVMWARLDLGGGQTLRVITGHPRPAQVGRGSCLLPVCYDPARRDAQLASIHALLAPWLAAGEHVLLLGDFNVSEREPAYQDLAAGLQDAYLAAGAGAGATWGPGNWASKWMPLLRIDYLLSSPTVVPLSTGTDCTYRGSDHCILRGTFALR
jgi:endonuclease/exonuclease/phosphatase family metal-dependent hydrolase